MSWRFYQKSIKGRLYWYKQKSYRVGENVKTTCVYISPVDGYAHPASAERAIGNPFLKETPSPKARRRTSRAWVRKISNLHLVTRCRASSAAIEEQWLRYRKQLEHQGITLQETASVTFQEGGDFGHRVAGTHITITIPKDLHGSGRNNLHRQYRSALATQYLALLATQKPSQYRALVLRTTGATSMIWSMAINHLSQSAKALSPRMLIATWASVIHGDDSKYLEIDLSTPTHIPPAAHTALAKLMTKGVSTTSLELKKDKRNTERRLNAAIKKYHQLSAPKKLLATGRKLREKIKVETARSVELSQQQAQLACLSPYWINPVNTTKAKT